MDICTDEKPLKIIEYTIWPLKTILSDHFYHYTPFKIQNILLDNLPTLNQLKETLGDNLIDFSCYPKDNNTSIINEFSGNPINCDHVQLKLSDYIDAMYSLELQGNNSHYLHNLDFNMYLAQYCLFNNDDTNNSPCQSLHNNDLFTIPTELIATELKIEVVNTWMNMFPVKSSLHYDAYHNILIVLQGLKTIKLISPEYTPFLSPHPCTNTAPNHSNLTSIDLKTSYFSSRVPCFDVTLSAGEALFIPGMRCILTHTHMLYSLTY